MDAKKTKEYLGISKFKIDPEANAVIIFENTQIEIGIINGEAKETKKVHKIIKLIKRESFKLADVTIFLPKENFTNYKYNIKGTTFNLDGAGNVKETKLPEADFYKNRIFGDFYEISFTMPDVKEGSIIDYSYELVSPFYYLLPEWDIQSEYPKLLTEYSIYYPAMIGFTSITHATPPLKEFGKQDAIFTAADAFCHYVANSPNAPSGSNYSFWLRRDVEALTSEPYVHNQRNYNERMDLQLILHNYINTAAYMSTWDKFNDLFYASTLSKSVRKSNDFMADEVLGIIKGDTSKLGMARAIYSYVRKNIKRNDDTKIADDDIKSVFYQKEGNAISINALLTAMMMNAGLDVFLLTTSTTASLSPNPSFPMMSRMNYLACAWGIDSSYVFLDASDKNNVFGLLPMYCYNGYSRVIGKKGEAVDLTPEMLENKNIFSVKITIPNDSVQRVEVTSKLGLIASSIQRKELATDKTDVNSFFEKYVLKMAADASIIDKKLEYLDQPDTNLIIKVTYEIRNDPNAASYFVNTSYHKIFATNPFLNAKRKCPIEFPYKSSDACYLTVVLPPNYEAESTPGPTSISIGENGMEYKKTVMYYPEMHTLTANVSYKNNEVIYAPENYATIREFFEEVIKDENKVIEIKKKK